MRRRIALSMSLVSLAAAFTAASPSSRAATDAGVRVERVSGEPVLAQRLTAIDAGDVVLDSQGAEVRVPLAEVVEIGFATPPDPPQSWTKSEVAADLLSGEILQGEIRSGDAKGFALESPLFGTIPVSLDQLAGVRFLSRLAQMPEPPDLHSSESTDVIHLVGGDRLTCTIEAFTGRSVRVESTTHEKLEVAYERMTALRVITDVPHKPKGTLLATVLRDGSQITGSSASAKDGRLRMKSVSGFDLDVALADVVAARMISERFVHLSDLPAAKTEVTPFWKPVAGDPAVLYQPRMDRSFSGRPLRCGGKSWVKGLGVYAGTSMTWQLDGNYTEFRSTAGIDDGAGPLGGVVFEVVVDGKSVWSSGFVRAAAADGRGKKSPVDAPRIDVKGAKSLTLRVLPGDAEDPWPIADEADWLGAMLVR